MSDKMSSVDYAEWLINRALKDGDNRKMRRGLNAAIKVSRRNGDYAHAATGMRQLAKLTRNMRKVSQVVGH